MKRIAQEERRRQGVVKYAEKHGQSSAPLPGTATPGEKVQIDVKEVPYCCLKVAAKGIRNKLIPPRTPWHNGKVERSHRSDQRYFYDWEKFDDVYKLNKKLKTHLSWSNNKAMRSLRWQSPLERLTAFLGSYH